MTFQTLMTWIGALRSDKYKKKINGSLRDGMDGFCALGVLHDVMSKGNWRNSTIKNGWITMNSIANEYGLSAKYQNMAYKINDGFKDQDGKDIFYAHTNMNTFEDVALYLEANKDEILETPNEN